MLTIDIEKCVSVLSSQQDEHLTSAFIYSTMKNIKSQHEQTTLVQNLEYQLLNFLNSHITQ